MPIHGVRQPQYILITDEMRLRKYDGNYEFAYDWYQDKETCHLVNGVDTPMKRESVEVMYEYLNAHGELYFIEYLEHGKYVPIGDVTFWREDMPIVIGNPTYRKRGLGYLVVKKLTERAGELGYDKIFVDEIYDYNVGSIKCFEKAGFLPYEKTEKGHKYCAVLSKLKSACNLREFAEIKNLCQAEECCEAEEDYKTEECCEVKEDYKTKEECEAKEGYKVEEYCEAKEDYKVKEYCETREGRDVEEKHETKKDCEPTEEPDISRVNNYEDRRFSKKALQQHGAFLVNGVFTYEVLITGKTEAVITGSNRKYEDAVIEYFRFFAEHITKFTDEWGNVVKEYPKVELFEVPLKNIQPSQFYVDKSKKSAVSAFVHSKDDVIIPLKKRGEQMISMDGHTRMSVAAEKGFDSVLAFWSADEADYLDDFVAEARKRNIFTPYDLAELEHDEYEEKWNGFCDGYFGDR